MNENQRQFILERTGINLKEIRPNGLMSEAAANEYKNWLIGTGRMSRYDAAQEKIRVSVRDNRRGM